MLTGFDTRMLDLPEGPFESTASTPKRLTLNFLTPTRIAYDGRLGLNLEFHILVRNLLRRLSLLSYFHGSGKTLDLNFKGIIEKAKDVKVTDRRLGWYDWERYSGRQEQRINMGGFVGETTFEGDLAPFLPFVKAGEVVHVGKGTVFGLGRYIVAQPPVMRRASQESEQSGVRSEKQVWSGLNGKHVCGA